MKKFFQTKAATYLNGYNFTIAVRKDCIEYYRNLSGKWHSVINIEWYTDAVRLIVCLGDFSSQFFGKVITEGISNDKNPKLAELILTDKYTIVSDETGIKTETHIFIDIKKKFPDFLTAIADPEVRKTIKETNDFFIDLHNELLHSTSPSIKPLYLTFYEQ